ncbi:MAG TPA: TraB/GumN family protein [Chitinophagales bacterium]|nr:TraB/GumN family protein [Chitinophagales bacterium]
MKIRILVLLLLAVATNVLSAQESLLWKVTSPNGKFTSYILCSTELPGVENYDIITPATPIISKVNTVAFFNVPDAAEIQNIPTFMKAPGDNTLKGYYKREDRIRFELMVADKLKENIETYYAYKPLYTLQLMREKDHAAGLDYQQTILLDIALQQKKPTLSLMTIRQIAGVMDLMDFNTQATVLSNYINTASLYIDADNEKFQAYAGQSMKDYLRVVNSSEQDAYITTMIGSMNDMLMKKMDPLLQQQSALFILDADLIGGDLGIIKKLQAKGYTVVAEPFDYKKYADGMKPDPNLTNNTINNATASNIPADDFPSFAIQPVTGGYVDPETIKVINIKDNPGKKPGYLAYRDPFGDFFDMQSADTLFMESWYELRGTDANFHVKVPVKGDWEESSTPWLEGGEIKKFVYQTNHAKSDVFYSIGYTVYPPSFKADDRDAFFNQFIQSTQDQISGQIISQRIVSNPNFTGREFTAVVGDSFFVRSQFLLQDNVLYQLLVGGPGDNSYSVYAEAFLNSFQTASNVLVNWFFFEQPSFSCYLPMEPSKSTKTYTLPSGPLQVQTFSAPDLKEAIEYQVVVSTYPAGHKFSNKKTFFDELIANAEKQYIGKALKVESVENNGVEGRYVEMQLMNRKIYRMYIYFDGTSTYQFVAGGDSNVMVSNNVNRFIQSMKMSAAKKK